jgi:hypothetical protein
MMVSLKMNVTEEKGLRTIRVAGLLVLAGASLGTTLGVYALLNPWLFSVFVDISQYEAMSFFLGFYLPSFVLIVALGYVFATTHRLGSNLWHAAPLSVLGFLCIVLSALSPFNILAFIGGILALTAVIFTYTKPAFKTLWRREASFLVETGSLLVASSSSLILLMWFISNFLPTYSAGFAGAEAYYLYALFAMTALAFLTFFTISSFGSRGAHTGFFGMLGLVAGITFSFIAVQSQYFYVNASAYLSVFLVGVGILFTLFGALIYVKLSFSQVASSTVLMSSFVFRGKYCPSCGEPWSGAARTFCSSCGQSIKWKPEVPFCPYCGRLLSKGVQTCPHCKEDVGSLPISYSLKKLEKKEMWITKRESKFQRVLRAVNRRVPLTLKEYVYVVILTFAFNFVSFIGFVRVEPHPQWGDLGFYLVHYGFPFEWVEIITSETTAGRTTFSLVSLSLDFLAYFLLAFFIVLGVTKLADYMRG